MKNLGTARERYTGGGTSATPLGRSGEPSRKWVRLRTTAHFFVGQRVGAHFVEQRDANDPDVASVVIFLGGVRFAHRAEAKRRHRFRALPKSFHHQLLMWIKNVTAFAKRSGSTSITIEPDNLLPLWSRNSIVTNAAAGSGKTGTPRSHAIAPAIARIPASSL